MKTKINASIYIPFKSFNCRFDYKKFKDLTELEAIMLSYIHCLKDGSRNFMQDFLNQFNLDGKWTDFFIEKLKQFNKNCELKIEGNISPETLMNGDIKLNEKISSKIEKHEFKGLETKWITKDKNILFPIFTSISNEKVIEKSNFKLLTKEKLKECEEKIFENYKKENYKSRIDDYAIELENDDLFIKSNPINESIEFQENDYELELELNKDKLEIFVPNKEYFEISNKFIEIKCDDLIVLPFLKILKIDKWSIFSENKNSELINFDDYENKLELNDTFISRSKQKNSDLFIEQQEVFRLHKKRIQLLINGKEIKNIYLLSKSKYINLEDYIISEIEKNNFSITSFMNDLKEKNKLHKFFIKKFDDLISKENIKQELIKNYLINNISLDLIRKCFYLRFISIKDWEILIKNNKSIFEKNINNVCKDFNDETYHFDQLCNEKIMKLIELIEIDLKIILDLNFKCIHEFKSIQNDIKLLEKSDISYEELDERFFKLKNQISKFEKQSTKLAKTLKIDNIQRQLSYKEEKIKEQVEINKIILQNKINDLMENCGFDKNKEFFKFNNEIKNPEIKKKMEKIREIRNEIFHGKGYRIENKNINKIIEINNKIKLSIQFIEENKVEIIDNFKEY